MMLPGFNYFAESFNYFSRNKLVSGRRPDLIGSLIETLNSEF